MATPSSDAGSGRGLRDRPLGRIALLLAVLLLAFVAARSCGSRETEVDEDEAVAIAREEVDFRPERVVVRFVPRGVESLPFWAVSLSSLSPSGTREECATVLVDGRTGEVAETRAC